MADHDQMYDDEVSYKFYKQINSNFKKLSYCNFFNLKELKNKN